uniref:Uncharacterized protein n=1 Tax=viral metagenome TaxID=1070528 RepID=A0A6H1ZXW3_9ZZZZ
MINIIKNILIKILRNILSNVSTKTFLRGIMLDILEVCEDNVAEHKHCPKKECGKVIRGDHDFCDDCRVKILGRDDGKENS